MRQFKILFISLFTLIIMTGCISTKGYLVKMDTSSNTIEEAFIKDEIQIKVINNYNESYDLKDVIIGYGTHPFNPLENKSINQVLISNNQTFNTKYSKYSKKGLEKSFFNTYYMKFTDEALLAILAEEYGMTVVISDTKNNKLYNIDYKLSNIILSEEIRQNIYYGFLDTLQYYEDRENDK